MKHAGPGQKLILGNVKDWGYIFTLWAFWFRLHVGDERKYEGSILNIYSCTLLVPLVRVCASMRCHKVRFGNRPYEVHDEREECERRGEKGIRIEKLYSQVQTGIPVWLELNS